jgi:hypothetical protein
MHSWFGWTTSDPNKKICTKKPKGQNNTLSLGQQISGCSGCRMPSDTSNALNPDGCTWVPMMYAK